MDQRLHTFLTLCDTLHYRAAAERLHITQPAVTQHIKSLELEYGCRLFSYEGRILTLLPEGETLRRYAQEALYRETELREALTLPQEPTLRIGATKTIGAYVLGGPLGSFLEKVEHRAEVFVDNTSVLLEMLDHNRLDFALIEGFFDKRIYDWRLLRREPFVGICAEGHAFAGREIELEEAFGETLLLREPGSGTRAILEQILREQNASFELFARTICISDFSLMAALTAANTGISFVYQAVAKSYPNLRTFTVKDNRIVREFNYVYLKNTSAASKIDYFLGIPTP